MIRQQQSHLLAAASTHPGMTGKNNEDRFAVTAYQLNKHNPTPAVVAVLSDGIGGHRGGEVAAEMAVNLISQYLAEGDGRYPPPMLQSAIQHSSQRIYERAQKEPPLQGMGATAAVAWVIGDRLYTANVGDSRIYLLRGDSIQQLSSDHTWIQEAIEQGLLDPAQAAGHPNAHIIRRFLGSPTPPDVDLRLRLKDGEDDAQMLENQGLPLVGLDIVLLCSDGLTDLVEDAEILAAFHAAPLQEAVDNLTALACERGGHDNITIVALQEPAQPLHPVQPASLRQMKGCLAVGIALLVTSLLAVLAFWGYATYLDRKPSPTPTPARTVQVSPTLLPPIELLLTPSAPPQTTPNLTQPPTPAQKTVTPPGGSQPTYTPWPTNTPGPTNTPSR